MRRLLPILLLSNLIMSVHVYAVWEIQYSNWDYNLNGVHFVDTLHGWVVGDSSNLYGEPVSGVILRTVDGGLHWECMRVTRPLNSVCFVDTLHGWAVGDSIILHTEDGGISWIEQDCHVDVRLYKVIFVNRDTGCAVGQLKRSLKRCILYTADGGNTWDVSDTAAYGALIDLWFVDENHGWTSILVALVGGVLRTCDGGITWQSIPCRGFEYICFTDLTHGWGVAQVIDGAERWVLFHTTDGGLNWTEVIPAHGDIFFIDEENGWTVDVWQNVFLHTTDGGITWESEDCPSLYVSELYFVDVNHGWAATEVGHILRYVATEGVEEYPVYDEVSISPNPFYDNVVIETNSMSLRSIKVYNILGGCVKSWTNRHAHKWVIVWDGTDEFGRHLSKGVYFCEFEFTDFNLVKKLIKLR